jgi:hypothetical protein
MTANNATNLRQAFNDAAQAVNPAAVAGPDTLKAVNLLVDALKAFADANTGDQTITLTGDVTGTGTGSFAATIANNAVVAAKIANDAVTESKILDASVTANKLTDDVLKMLVFTGVDASVEAAPATLLGVYAGYVVVGVVNLTDGASVSDAFEGVITVDDQIQQAESNLAAKTLLVILISKIVAAPE